MWLLLAFARLAFRFAAIEAGFDAVQKMRYESVEYSIWVKVIPKKPDEAVPRRPATPITVQLVALVEREA